jgi:hypothetical protein
MINVTTSKQLHALQTETWVWAAVVLLVALFVAWGISTLISWEGGKDRSYIKRRWACGIVWAVAWIGFFLYNDLYVMDSIKKTAYKTLFSHTIWQTLGALAVGYVVLLVLLALVTPNSKLGSILHLKK